MIYQRLQAFFMMVSTSLELATSILSKAFGQIKLVQLSQICMKNEKAKGFCVLVNHLFILGLIHLPKNYYLLSRMQLNKQKLENKVPSMKMSLKYKKIFTENYIYIERGSFSNLDLISSTLANLVEWIIQKIFEVIMAPL
ncbi:MAG: hypothetical protein ABS939_03110 [Psychrobacillus sp.]